MSVSTEVKRTLVKSPPELWCELSDPESLARHLDGMQQIRITRTEPEAAVEWEADGASGSVHLQPSGFGTKVTLSLSRELTTPPASEPCVAEPESEAVGAEPEPEPAGAEPEPEPVATEPKPEPAGVEPDPQPPTGALMDTEPEVAADEPDIVVRPPTSEGSMADPTVAAPPQGFLARLFKRRRKPPTPIVEAVELNHDAEPERVELTELQPEISTAVESAAAEPILTELIAAEAAAVESGPVKAQAEAGETVIAAERAPHPVEPQVSVTADLEVLEAEMGERDEAMLIAMLDRLGAAHHRPFSRS